MNTYRIKTTTITFEVNAEDSDMATVAAEEWIKRRGIPIESQRAELHLLDGEESMNLGSFHLAGVNLPGTWKEIRKMKSDLFAVAKQDARENWDLSVIRSRGAVLVVEDKADNTIISTGEGYSLPDTLRGFQQALAAIKQHNPTAHRVWMCIGCDAAESVTDMHDDNYTPWAGEAQAVVYEYPATSQINEQ